MTERIPAIIYAAKSTKDNGSIEGQTEDCREMAERQGWTVVDEFSDEAFSAYSGNRGPGLDRAKALAVEVAAKKGRCILVAQDADRFARGAGDAPGAADHLGEIFFVMKRQAVELWTVRSGHLDGIRAFLEGERSHGESARKTQAVKAGKRRQAKRGEHLGGALPDGYTAEYTVVDGRKSRKIVLDPERAAVIRSIFEMASEGVPDAQIARRLNIEGVTTRKSNPWTRRAVQDAITRPFYAGRIIHDGETFDGKHEHLIDPAVYDRLIAARAQRDLGRGSHVKGRPAPRHALQGLAVCGKCGRRMYSRTSSYGRKDGTRQRTYVCPGYVEANATCSMSIDATMIDGRVLASLDGLLPDFEAWIAQVTERQSSERQQAEALRDRCFADRDKQARRVEKLEGAWAGYVADGRQQDADTALPIVERERQELRSLQTRAEAAQDALDGIPREPPADALLDFALGLQRALRGIDGDEPMAKVNADLARIFDSFTIRRTDDVLTLEPQLHASVARALIANETEWVFTRDDGPEQRGPVRRMHSIIRKDDAPPPLRWLSAVSDNSDHSQWFIQTNHLAFAAAS